MSEPQHFALVLSLFIAAGCEAPDDDFAEDSDGDDEEFRIVDPTPVDPDELLGMVQVEGRSTNCSGMLIARDTVLTAAHCICTQDWIGNNDCGGAPIVTFRDNPNQGGDSTPKRSGVGTAHPGYNPSWTASQVENDIAIITLDSDAPTYVPTFAVARTKPSVGTNVMVAGFGKTGSDCDGDAGTLNSDIAAVAGYEDSGDIMRFDPAVVCKVDSGGAVLDLAGTRIHGVHSSRHWSPTDGWVSKAAVASEYYDWIRENTCAPLVNSYCDASAPICVCGEGEADCDTDADCSGDLVCVDDVGAAFGHASNIDVCLEPTGPLEGLCGCNPSGIGNLCIATYNDCTPGFSATCDPLYGNGCGPCTCE